LPLPSATGVPRWRQELAKARISPSSAAHDDQRDADEIDRDVVARIGDLIDMAEEIPYPHEQVLDLQIVEIL
tara:strand:- start:153 stop:368 length:216 start_codon:yes stop_codon:yes gene_type:complete